MNNNDVINVACYFKIFFVTIIYNYILNYVVLFVYFYICNARTRSIIFRLYYTLYLNF